MLQILCLYERVLHKVLCVFVNTSRSGVRKQADNAVVVAYTTQMIDLLSIPFRFLFVCLNVITSNVLLSVWVMLLVGTMLSVSESSSSVLSLYVNTYNAGIGASVDLFIIKPLQVFDLLFRCLIPLYNAVVWTLSQLFIVIIVPFFGVHVDRLPALVGDFGLMTVTTSRAVAILLARYIQCGDLSYARSVVGDSFSNVSNPDTFHPFTSSDTFHNMQCIANTNYMTLDLMTPGIYARKTMVHIHYMATSSCTVMTGPFDVMLYPFLDYNLYKSVHCLINTLLHVVIALPILTHARCEYARDQLNSFSELEQAVMCAPDWKPLFTMITAGIKSLGKLVDNWLNVILLVLEHLVGRSTLACAQTHTVGDVWDGVADKFETKLLHLKVVGISDAMFAVTDGVSSAYHTMTDGASTVWALGLFPFQINTMLGVAAVKYGEVYDSDRDGDDRTGLFGCRCVDVESALGVSSIHVVCSSVPYQSNVHDNDADYSTNTVHDMVFDSSTATTTMTCSQTVIRVSSLRFSRKRFAAVRSSGADSLLTDPFSAFDSAGSSPINSYTADATVHIQPLCDGPRESCLSGIDNCFPWCMGLHVAGQRNQQIRLYNARKWEDFITLTQLDCVVAEEQQGECAGGTGARVVDLDMKFSFQSTCGVSAAFCSNQDSSNTIMPLDNMQAGPGSALLYKRETHAMLRLSKQPFVTAGDVYLHQREVPDAPGEYELLVTRLYDNNQGAYSMQYEQLSLLSNRQTVKLKLCETEDDAYCYMNALTEHTIILPHSYVTSAYTNIATSSQWAVHWAVNPENAIFATLLDFCATRRVGFTITVASSYSKPRVWTLKTVRAASVNPSLRDDSNPYADENGLYSYMVVPDWVVYDVQSFDESMCDKKSNFKIVDLEYINENNVLVTALYTTMRNYRLDGTVCDGCDYEYKRYFLHPNRHDCVAPDEGDGALFTCWRHERLGMFEELELPVEVYGEFCPALRRMPHAGSLVAELTSASVHAYQLVLDAMTLLIAAAARNADFADLFELRMNKPTFHHMLDSSGSDLFDFEEILRCLDKAALFVSDVIVKTGKIFSGSPAYVYVEPVFAGTAKIIQHTVGYVELKGPLARQYKAIQDFTSRQSAAASDVTYAKAKGKALGFLQTMRGWLSAQGKSLKVSLKILKKMTIKQVIASARKKSKALKDKVIKEAAEKARALKLKTLALKDRLKAQAKILPSQIRTETKRVASVVGFRMTVLSAYVEIKDVFTTTIAESVDEIERSYLDNLRVMCDGAAQILGTSNALALTVRHACLLVPDGLKAVLTMFTVLVSDYDVMDCVCRMPEEQVRTVVIDEECAAKMIPSYWRAWVLEQRRTPAEEVTNMCHSSMDAANHRLLTAFDIVSARLVKLTEAMQNLLNYVVVAMGMDTGDCNDYKSPYMVSIMPEPADYFMPCIHTPDCRIKCLDEVTAFEAALSTTTVVPEFFSSVDLYVESKYFSVDDIENNRHLPPFEVIGIAELWPNECRVVCSSGYVVANRCLSVVGIEEGHSQVGLAYYCIPADMTTYVYKYEGPAGVLRQDTVWNKYEIVQEGFMMSVHRLSAGSYDDVLVMTLHRTTGVKSMYMFTAHAEKFTLLRSEEFDFDTYNYVEDIGSEAFALNSLDRIRVIPATRTTPTCDVFVTGSKVSITYYRTEGGTYLPEQTIKKMCLRKRITTVRDDLTRPLQVQTTDCTAMMDEVFSPLHHGVCVNEQCTRVLNLPITKPSEMQTDTFTSYLDFDRDTLAVTEAERYFPESTSASSLAQIIRYDASKPLYTTEQNVGVLNKKHLSVTAPRRTLGVRGVDDGTVTAEVLVSGTISSHRSWVQSIRFHLDPSKQRYGALLSTSTLVKQTMDMRVQCSVDNCVGCQTNPWQLSYVDLQSKCFAASRCGIQKCVGTAVDMRKPFCNAASLLMEPLELFRIALHSGWKFLARSVITIVELSKNRRDAARWEFPDDDLMQGHCLLKDTVVETVAVFTSTLGSMVRFTGMRDKEFTEDRMRSDLMDARWYARYFMSSTALTNFLASLFMGPIYSLIAVQKVLSCGANDVVALVENIDTLQAPERFTVTSRSSVQARQEKVTSVCLSQAMAQRMRELGLDSMDSTNSAMANEYVSIVNQLEQLGTSFMLHMLSVPVDVFFANWIGILSTFMDWLQTIDWKHCSLPVIGHSHVFTCVCGDQAHTVVNARRVEGTASAAFWCTGPLLMIDSNGEDRLIWNPYSLSELTEAEEAHAAFIECISDRASCEAFRHTLPALEEQSVNVLPVITKCRENYKNKQWDAGVLVLGLFTVEAWENAPVSLQYDALDEDTPPYLQRYRTRLRAISSLIDGFQLDEQVWACLNEAVVTGNSAMQSACLKTWAKVPLDEYFAYVHTESRSFAGIDACLSFSGDISAFNTNNNAARSLIMWTGSSLNRVPVAERHEILASKQSRRLAETQARLDDLWESRINPALQTLALDVSDSLRTNLWSVEGDELHQFMDCIMMGPYASADLHSSFDMSGGGGKFEVPRYHRGRQNSREFGRIALGQTQGSGARKRIIAKVLEHVHGRTDDLTRSAAVNRINLIRTMFADKENFVCLCQSGPASLLCCAQATQISEIQFGTKRMFEDIYNLQTDVVDGAMATVLGSGILDDIWTSSDFTYVRERDLTDTERLELSHAYVFDTAHPVREYSVSEVPESFTDDTLWTTCTSLVSASFFTLPTTGGTVDADVIYNPATVDSEEYLHGMEQVIHKILQRARRDSPVFWTHSHRYVASDSVWCESASDPVPSSVPETAFQTTDWRGHAFAEERVRASTMHSTVFVGALASSCLCGWHSGDSCHIPIACNMLDAPPALAQTWLALCSRGTYTTRGDLFDFMHILQTSSYHPRELESCRDLVPDVVWGLLSPADQLAWYSQDSSTAPAVDLKHIATHGPSGVRLGLIGRDNHANSLAAYIKTHDLLRKHPQHPTINRRLRHTIAQPVCESSLSGFLKEDLTLYFRDVLFPMAHSVSEAPAAAYCSTWAIERTIELAMRQMFGDSTPDVLQQQTQTVVLWRKRCDTQLKQIGICVLRGVYDLAPDNTHLVPSHCAFAVAASHGCAGVFYVTQQCVVRCDSDFYDPCLCSDAECTSITFQKAACAAGRLAFNPSTAVTDEATRLYSMNWPDHVPASELPQAHGEELDELLLRIRAALPLVSFDDSTVMQSMAQLIVATEPAEEHTVPHAHCDDLLDYFPEEAQHPVGYHPTCACRRSETNMRGFDSWMSTTPGSAHGWSVDPVRLRNMTQYSTSYGSAHLVCDAAVYGAYDHQLNGLDLHSRWDVNAPADPAVPRAAPTVHEADMTTTGVPSGLQFDTPLVHVPAEGADVFRHSTGLVRDWLSLYGSDPALEAALDHTWPHWDENQDDTYGSAEEEVLDNCVQPPLLTCLPGTTDCCGGLSDCVLACRTRTEEDTEGICVHRDTCFRHAHCLADNQLCSGDGQCVAGKMYVRNSLGADVDVQLFSADTATCAQSGKGYSSYEGVPDFGRANGMCSFRDWFHYQNITRHTDPDADSLLHVRDRLMHRTDEHAPRTLKEAETLKTLAHACDRTYQHTEFGICQDTAAGAIKASYSYLPFSATSEPVRHSTAVRTWAIDGQADDIRFCDMGRDRSSTNPINGFLSPYEYEDALTQTRADTLRYVPETVGRCVDFGVCHTPAFLVQGLAARRLVAMVERSDGVTSTTSAHRKYSHADAESCFGAGLLVADTTTVLCVVDRMAVPMMNFLFSPGAGRIRFLPYDVSYKSADPATEEWSQQTLLQSFDEVRARCPRAFSQDVDGRSGYELYYHILTVLASPYEPSAAAEATRYANLLLPAVFGVGTAGDATRGFDSIEQYLELATCARYIDTSLQEVVSQVFLARRAYTTESVFQEQVGGDSLYLFHARAAEYVPFRWFWQCVVISTSTDGGAPQDWFRVMTDEDYDATDCTCVNYEDSHSKPLTVKARLQTSPHIYTISDDIPDMASAMAHAVYDTVGIALGQLGLPMFPDMYYMRRRATSDCVPTNLFVEESCWEKFGRDATQIVNPEELLLNTDGASIKSLYARMREIIGFVDGDLHDMTLQDLANRQLVELRLALDDVVSADTNFFPAVRFTNLAAVRTIPSYQAVVQEYIPPAYAGCGEPCEVYTLSQFEYKVQDGRTVDVDVYEGLARRRRVVTQEEAEYLLVESFKKLIYYQTTFASNNIHIDSRTSSTLMAKQALRKLSSGAVREYNSFMRTKTFRCTTDIQLHQASNRLHDRLRTCAEHLQDTVGWHLPDTGILHVEMPASVLVGGFIVSYAEARPASEKFLQNLTSAAWADDAYVSMFDVMCFQLRGETHTINPYWAVDYDVATGCDTFHQDDLRLIDGRCLTQSAGEQCSDRFPAYQHALSDKLPERCSSAANTVATGRRGTFRAGLAELCDRRFESPQQCKLRHGSFAGATGRTVQDTEEVHEVVLKPGLWEYSNSIFRGSVLRPAMAEQVEALQLLPSDISGNSLEFDIDSNGQLVLKCVNLVGEEAQGRCAVSNQHWMQNIREHWAWQHQRQMAIWPVTQQRASPVSWKCPLQILQAHSGDTATPYSMRSPSRNRNAYRFSHITEPYSYAHPIASSVVVPVLMAGRFLSETQVCTASNERQSLYCHSESLLQNAIAHARELMWLTVSEATDHAGAGVSCSHILDWPHERFHTWDESVSGSPQPVEHCSVFDRLPRFQIKLEARSSPRPHTGRTSIDRGGVCRMARLRSLAHPTSHAQKHLQYCLAGDAQSLHCRYLDTTQPTSPTTSLEHEPEPAANAPPAPRAFRKNTHCAACDQHKHGSFIHTDGSTHSLPDTRSLLSTGQKMQVSTTRMLAAYLRKLVCPVAATDPCPELLRVFNTAHWTSGSFLGALFSASSTTDFYNSYYHVESPPVAAETLDDAALWSRNWVWCEPGAAHCSGSVSKHDWINPVTRTSTCRAAITTAAQNSTSQVHFCMIDSNTARLCQLVVEWNLEITSILCRAAGLPSCAETGFFYNPTSYSPDNREFEHDSVRSFYSSSSSTVCDGPSDSTLTQMQIDSNTNLMSKCASMSLNPILVLLRASRDVVNLLVELVYYAQQIAFNILFLVVQGLLPSRPSVVAIADKIILFFRLILDTLADIIILLYQVVYKIVFGRGITEAMTVVLKAVCHIVQFIIEYPIKKAMCPVLRTLHKFFGWLYGVFETIWSASILGLRPFFILEATVGTYLSTQMKVLDVIIALACDMDKLQCDFMDEEVEPRNGPGALPVVTRCWSTYVTFYGDGQSLACTKADTCRRSLTDHTPVMCGTCSVQDPPNPLTHQFGCDSITKTCTCATPRLTDSFCYSNNECALPGPSCGFLNSELEPANALTVCEACTTRPVCYVPRGGSVGRCMCGLFEIPFAKCRFQDLGSLIALPYSKMCVLQPDARYRYSASYTAEFGLALATPCMAVDASTSFCTRMVDLANAPYIVSTHTTQGRRLLEAVGSEDAMQLGHNSTHNPVCKDALGSSTDTHVRRMCVDLFVRSASTVLYLELSATVPPCAFCSEQDFWNMMQLDPMIVPFLIMHPQKLWYVLLEHTGLARASRLYSSLLQSVQLFSHILSHTNVTDYIGINVTASGIVVSSKDRRYISGSLALLLQSYMNSREDTVSASATPQTPANASIAVEAPRSPPPSEHRNASTPPPAGARALLSLNDLSRDLQKEVARAYGAPASYSAQISSAYNYNFPTKKPLVCIPIPQAKSGVLRNHQWSEHWPPVLGSSSLAVDGTCTPARDIAFILYYAAGNATLFYSAQSRTPHSTLRDSFPHLQSSRAAAAVLKPNPDSKLRNDPLLNSIMWILKAVASTLGLQTTFFYDTLYSMVFEIQQNVMCDLEAVQTCSKWNVKMSNGVLVIGFYFTMWFLLLGAFRLEFLAALSVPFFWVMLLRLCYGYSWTCFPTIPACLLEDVYTSIAFFFPKMMLVPQTLWLNSACADLAVVEPACLKTCQDSPFFYTSAQSVMAWFVAEFGGSATDLVFSILEWQTVLDLPQLREDIMVKQKVIADNEHGLITGHRLCATVGTYRLLPYILLAFLSVTAVVFLTRTVVSIIYTSFSVSLNNFISSFA